MGAKKRIAVFASGNGSNFEAIARACADGRIDAEVGLCVCDQPGAGVEARARRLGVPVLSTHPREHGSKAAFETALADRLDSENICLVCLAGYMRIVGPTLLARYEGRIVNIHPALLPAFPGAHAIDDAFAYGVKVYGVTIHYVDAGVDSGRIIAQSAIPYAGHDRDEIETMIHRTEHRLYVETINQLLND